MTGDEHVRVVSPTEHVVELVLDRPHARNAVSTALARELTHVLGVIAGNRDVRALVVSSSDPRAFCAGADLKERASFDNEQLLAQRPVIRALFGAVLALPMPAIAAVAGFALGGGFELALSCDLIVADESAVFGLTEVTVGLVPGGGGTQLLARRVGAGAAADLVLTGRKVGAADARALGIVDRLAEPGLARATALDVATSIAANAPVAVRAAKAALRAALGTPVGPGLDVEDAAWRSAAVSADRGEGIRAFAEKRAPHWSGT